MIRLKTCYGRRYSASQKRRRGWFIGEKPRDRNFRRNSPSSLSARIQSSAAGLMSRIDFEVVCPIVRATSLRRDILQGCREGWPQRFVSESKLFSQVVQRTRPLAGTPSYLRTFDKNNTQARALPEFSSSTVAPARLFAIFLCTRVNYLSKTQMLCK